MIIIIIIIQHITLLCFPVVLSDKNNPRSSGDALGCAGSTFSGFNGPLVPFCE